LRGFALYLLYVNSHVINAETNYLLGRDAVVTVDVLQCSGRTHCLHPLGQRLGQENNSKNRAADREENFHRTSQRTVLFTATAARSSNPMLINIAITQKLGLNGTSSKGNQFRYVTYG
jgi:hypothetical protein